MSPEIATIAGTVILLLIALVGWFAQHNYQKMEQDLEEERKARAIDRHNSRDEVQRVVSDLSQFKFRVAEDYVSERALEQALRPLTEGIHRVEGTIKDLFIELKSKADKPG